MSFTKGGVAKRVYKPTIPSTRRPGRGVTGGTGVAGGVDGGASRDQNNSCNSNIPNGKVKGKEKSFKPKGKKELIQLDATFNGINITSPAFKAEKAFISPGGSGYGQSHDTRTLRSSQSDSPRINGCVKLENGETSHGIFKREIKNESQEKEEDGEEDVESIQRALYRDDFVSHYDPNDEDKTPIGWNQISKQQIFKQENKMNQDSKPTLKRFDDWVKTKKGNDKMVLFQLPEMLLNSSDGHVGKIRMYQSGKMELVDTRSGMVYDLLHTNCDVNTHPDHDDGNEKENSDDDTTSEDNEETKDDNNQEESAASDSGGKSNFSTDWIKKEVDEETEGDPRNFDFLPPAPFNQPSTSKSSHSMQSPSNSSSSSHNSSKFKLMSSSKSKSSSKNLKANHNRKNKCDKNEDKDNRNDDDDDDTQEEDDDQDSDDEHKRNINRSYREACTFDGQQIVCLGPISDNQLLIARPRLDKFFNP